MIINRIDIENDPLARFSIINFIIWKFFMSKFGIKYSLRSNKILPCFSKKKKKTKNKILPYFIIKKKRCSVIFKYGS